MFCGWDWGSTVHGVCLIGDHRRPVWPPGLRPEVFRKDFGAGLANPSVDGGFEEFREFAATCRSNSAIRAS